MNDWHHCDDFQHAPLPGPILFIQKLPDGRFVWRAAFFILGKGYQETGGFSPTNRAAMAAIEEFERELGLTK